mmetsp:Transcript_59643/g.106007  ORF Transcript_59643/g.106007 Transcript_59643/m.106007 type:complete len:163 (+) Transcript_59643:90-578(+)|eukprot:CAMPEP_0197625324 /NCGR_PEP_ID=MMETSP1338-20131121/4720_1 /TAXON_ID=43686 ORGANISM="Pelagodinium beii, Strain RCC1491" /NCGR_SAMPLE_ID=MMETSP1338 /ASSEMBLY_ACC=CAM_ASM_000754 /LENGTH=162 /DNA_ID=CAMNT_0043195701 /DNA_START=81 /DNA_END=569 /DNA_ORIENTATION=-
MASSADDLLQQMVSKDKDAKEGDGTEAKNGKDGKAAEGDANKALPAPKVQDFGTIDSDDEPPPPAKPAAAPQKAAVTLEINDDGKDKKEKKEKKKKKKSSSSSSSSSASAEDALTKKRRINNFSSIRNVEKERASVRASRNAGAAAAKGMLQALSDNPYFAP